MSRSRAIADMYPLTPAQEGMLFHTLLAPDSGVYVQQVSATVRGVVDAPVFERVWEALIDRHPVLRTSFVSDRRRPPFQVVHRTARLPWTYEDWRDVPTAAQQARLAERLREDRRRGFAVERPPLMRVALFRLADDRSQVVWTHHHLLLDGWSVPLVLAELVALYDAFAAGTVPSLPARRPFRDFVAWLRARTDAAESERFWRQELRGIAGPTPLPSSGTVSGTSSRTPSGTSSATSSGTSSSEMMPGALSSMAADGEAPAMAGVARRLSAEQTGRLQQVARERRLTLNTMALGAWAIVSSRYSGDEDVIFGSTVSGRPPDLPGADTMIGLFINTLPVRVRVPPAALVVEWLGELQARFAALRRFEHTSLTSIHGWSGLPRDTALFESLVVFENYPVDAAQSARSMRLAIEHADSDEQTNYPLTVVVVPGDELLLKADYDTRRLDRDTVDRLLAWLARVLTALTETASRRIADVPWFEDAERERVLRDWNRTDAPPGAFVHERFAAQAHTTPDATAIRDMGGIVTFGDLAARVERCARRLHACGVQPEVRVAIALPPGTEAIVAMLGVLRAGGAYVPVDPSYPAPRKRFVVEDSGARLVVVHGDADWLPSSAVRLDVADTTGDRLNDAGAGEDDVSPNGVLTAHSLAYIIYTSGSTGQPKGAMITHRGLANYLEWAVAAYEAAAGTGSPLHTPLGFDLTVTSVFPALLSGKCIDIVAAGDGLEALAARLATAPGYSLVKLTPAHVEALGQLLAPSDAGGATRALVIGGEALLEEPLAFWRAHAPGTRLINEYGPTETVVGCCVHDATRDVSHGAAIPIGRPIANTRLYIVDRAGSPVPIGVAGELLIGGAGVARGYHGRADLTAERFVPDPFGDEPGARLYRTGDRCQHRQDGVLEFLGRLDDQVKIRGFRIEPAEIEAALRRHPGVAACAVVAQPSGAAPSGTALSGGARLVAFVVEAAGESATGAVIDATAMPWDVFLTRELPAHMVPAVFERVPELPLTAHGKVDRRALAARPLSPRQVHRSLEPQGAAEELVAALWGDVLSRPAIGRDDKFFDLGGHSLLATRIVARARAAFELDIPLRAIFDAPTVAAFTAHIEQLRGDGTATTERPIAVRAQPETAPLSFAQRRLWFIHQLDVSNAAYNIRYAVRLAGPFDAEALQRSLDAVAERHEVLRARFESVDGKPHQIIDAAASIPLIRHDLRATAPAARDRTVRALVDEDAVRPFDLERGPLVRALLLELGQRDAMLLVSMHHIVSDAWSVEILIRELTESYAASTAGGSASLPDLPVQYADYAAWQRAVLDEAACDRHLAYWAQQLEDVAVLDLPTDRSRPEVPTLQGAALSFSIPADVTARVDALCAAESVTPFMILLAVFQILLGRHAGQDDVAVGTPIANRGRPEIDGLIGFFTNTLVLRTRLRERQTFRELVASVREVTLAAFAHQELPFEMVVDRLVKTRDLAKNPLFQVMFTTATPAPVPGAIGDVQLTSVPLDTATAKFDLSLSMARDAAHLTGTFEYSSDLFESGTVQRLAAHYTVLLEHAVGTPDLPIHALPMLTPDAREEVVIACNRTAIDHGAEGTVIALFEAQAARTPDLIAVECEDGHLTYAELEERASLVARGLEARGVSGDEVVGLCLDRGIDLVVAMLGILKAGAAYVPLDRTYPADRLSFMLADSGARLVVSDGPGREAVREACATVDVQALEAAGRNAGPSRVPTPRHPDALAYVIYTSGSTGRPKGAMIPHRALHNHMCWMQRVFPLSAEDRVLQKTPISFDASVWEFYAPLLAGARLAMARPGGQHDATYLIDAIGRYGTTVLQVVPSLLRMLFDAGGLASCRTLKRLFCGGEPLTGALQERVLSTLGCELHNLYGPTEATIDTVTWTCRDRATRTVPIGRPIDNTTAYVLDSRFEPVPPGVVGELYLGGMAVGRGYIGQPAATAARFLPDPFGAPAGGRLYRTGDRVRRFPDGVLEFVDRVDGQVKIRGMRVELGEVEAVLGTHVAVRDVVVTIREHRSGVHRLVAYVVARSGASLDPSELRAFVRRFLPEHMTPAAVVTLDALPRLPNGKLDRRSLPEPADPSVSLGPALVAPRNEVENILAAIWRDVIGLERVGVKENFFEIGGDSILSLQVVSRARAHGLYLSAADLFRYQTIEALAAVAGQVASAPRLERDGRQDVPLTPIQQWFFGLDLPAPHHWNQALMLEAASGVHVEALEQALATVMARHDVFTLGFARTPDGWQQRAMTGEPRVAVQRVDLAAVPAAQRDEGTRAAADRVQASLLLDAPPLLRAAVFDFGPIDPPWVLLVLHHLIVDAVSWRILLEELGRVYPALARGEHPLDAPVPAASFADWASALVSHADSRALLRERGYWLDPGRGVARPLPRDRAIASAQNDERSASRVERTLDRAATATLLQRVPSAYNTRTLDVLLTALVETIGAWTGERRALIDLEGHGREEISAGVDVSGTIGWFTTLYPLSIDLEGFGSGGAALKHVKEVLRTVPQRGLGYGVLRYLSSDADVREAIRSLPAAEISFNYLGQVAAREDTGWRAIPDRCGSLRGDGPRPHLIEVIATVIDSRLVIRWIHGPAHTSATMQSIADRFLGELTRLTDHCVSGEAGGYTPSDFAAAAVSQRDLDKLVARLRQ